MTMKNDLLMPKKKYHFLLAIALVGLAGCGDGRGLMPASGVITYEGKPVTTGTVVFYPAKGRPASAEIRDDGSFELSSYNTGDGLPPGNYTVCVTSVENTVEGNFDNPGRQMPVRFLVPEKYCYPESSPIEIEVAKAKEHKFEIDLPINK